MPIHHGKQILADIRFKKHPHRTFKRIVWTALTITVWSVFIIKVLSDSGLIPLH